MKGASLRILLICGVAVSAPACETSTVPFDTGQYDFRLAVAGAGGVQFRTFHWDLGSDVPVFINEPDVSGRPSMTPALDTAAVRWTRAAVFGEVRLRPTTDLAEAVAVLQWRDTEPILSTPVGCTGPGGGAASTTGCLNETSDSLVVWPRRDLEPSQVVFSVVVQNQPAMTDTLLAQIVTHEMGHVLGILAHSPTPGDLMFGGFLTVDDLTSADQQTLRTLYQSPVDLAY
jgi:hypothetical protein